MMVQLVLFSPIVVFAQPYTRWTNVVLLYNSRLRRHNKLQIHFAYWKVWTTNGELIVLKDKIPFASISNGENWFRSTICYHYAVCQVGTQWVGENCRWPILPITVCFVYRRKPTRLFTFYICTQLVTKKYRWFIYSQFYSLKSLHRVWIYSNPFLSILNCIVSVWRRWYLVNQKTSQFARK